MLSCKYRKQWLNLSPRVSKGRGKSKALSKGEFGLRNLPLVEPQLLKVLKDPEAERKRQLYDGTDLPGLIAQAQRETDEYLKYPFLGGQGVISELHFGQAMYSYNKKAQTIFKTAKADILCVPIGHTDSTFAEYSHSSGNKGRSGNVNKKGGGSSVLSGKPKAAPLPKSGLLSTGNAKAKLALERAERERKEKEAELEQLQQGEGEEVAGAGGKKGKGKGQQGDLLSLICKYETGKCCRRDVEFLHKLNELLNQSMNNCDFA